MLSGILSLRKWKIPFVATVSSLVLASTSVSCRITFLYSKDNFLTEISSFFPSFQSISNWTATRCKSVSIDIFRNNWRNDVPETSLQAGNSAEKTLPQKWLFWRAPISSGGKRGKMFNQSQARGNVTVASAGKHVTCVNHSKTCNRCWRRAESRGAPSRVGALKSLPFAENRGEKVTVSKLGKTHIQCHSENV